MVAQAEAIDLHLDAVDSDGAVHAHVLLVVRLRELLLRIDDAAVRAAAAVGGTAGLVDQVELHLLEGVVLEREPRLGHLLRLGEVDGGAHRTWSEASRGPR